jgi:uncharacterized BrkB/YihY/UPF0761 family membrane protein
MTDRENRMAERKSPYKQVSLEDAVADTQAKHSLSALDEPWQAKKARLRTASILAIGLLVLFGLTIACSGIVITTLVIASASSNKPDATNEIGQMVNFATVLLPYIATPLGVALGYYFRETQVE